jgi:predicted phosphodiesterase
MRLAIISDIHGNWDALQAVLENLDAANVDETVCLGDNIGYGPEPNEVIETLQQRNIPSVLGNHELALLEPERLEWFNPAARRSLSLTIERLTENSRDFIARMETVRVAHGCRFVHGFPPASATTYYFELAEEAMCKVFDAYAEKHCFIGHSHDLVLLAYRHRQLETEPLTKGRLNLQPDVRYIINAGSVGQPRDGENSAKYLIWDTTGDVVEVRYIAYDIAAVARKIIDAGLPEIHAHRLW